MYVGLDLLNGLQHQNPNQAKPNKTKPNLTSLPLKDKFSVISYPIKFKLCMFAKEDLPGGLQHQKPNHTMIKYAVIWSQNVHFVITFLVHLTKKLL